MPSSFRDEKLMEAIRVLAAEYINREAGRQSLITVTHVQLSKDGKKAAVLVTVLPETKEKEALDFLKRVRTEFRAYFKEKLKVGLIPFFDFEIDIGEKNRQRIDEISNEDKQEKRSE